MMAVGFTPYLRRDLPAAERAWRKVEGVSSRDSAEAAFSLGVLLEEQGDGQGARATYQRAVDSGHLWVAPLAERSLSDLDS
jgi:hypothetical protein